MHPTKSSAIEQNGRRLGRLTGSKDSDVDVLQEADISETQCADNVGSNGLLPVVLAPIDIWSASATSAVQNMGWLDPLELGDACFPILHANSGGVDLLSLALQESLQVSVPIVSGSFSSSIEGQRETYPATQPSPPQMRKTGFFAVPFDAILDRRRERWMGS